MPASGAVSSMAEAASSVVPGSAPSPSRPAWRWAARSPRLLPSATKTRSRRVDFSRSCLDNKVTRDPLEIRREIAELTDRALEVGLSRRGLARPLGERVGVCPALGRAGGDLLDLP